MGLLLAVALVLSYIESVIPLNFGIPGMKLGLPNLAVVLTLYLFGWKEALLINLTRILLSGFMFGNMAGILFSLAGAGIMYYLPVLLIAGVMTGALNGIIAMRTGPYLKKMQRRA